MSGDATIREARDIISRWSSGDMLDRITALPSIPEMSSASALAAQPSATRTSATGTAAPNALMDDDSKKQSSDFNDDQESDQHQAEQNFNGSDSQDESQEDAKSILADLDRLARQANLTPDDAQDTDGPSAAYLKLAEIERPNRKQATVDVTDLLSDEPVSSEAQPATSAETNPQDNESTAAQVPPKGAVSVSPDQESHQDDAFANAPSLGSLLKQSNSSSVGQLAWKIDAEKVSDPAQQQEPETQQQTDPSAAAVASNSAATNESLHSEPSSQLRTATKQTKIELDSEGESESGEGPVNFTASDQVAQNPAAAGISTTNPEEAGDHQPILPMQGSDNDSSSIQSGAASNKRVAQSRKAQRRKQHPRKLKQAASARGDDDQKGMNTVSRKYRIDNPNPESGEPALASQQQGAASASSHSNSTGRRFRIDSAESMGDTLETGDSRVRTQGRSRQRYINEAHGTAIRGPHFEVVGKKRSNMASITGQFLAYLGVLGLTVGTAIVIYGHFGGMSEYTPTGWLVTTVAQMMLFLGVINLVSGGIEQNNEDVSVRINTLGEQLMRIEQVTEQALRGPKIAASRYADPDAVPEESRSRGKVDANK